MNINFFAEGIEFHLNNSAAKAEWVSSIISQHNKQLGEINYIFCSDDYVLEINRQHLDHNYYTDIITFDNSDTGGVIESDIFISIDRVEENAHAHSCTAEEELNRVMIHGILHLLGYGDKTDKEKKQMREKEDACLSLLKI